MNELLKIGCPKCGSVLSVRNQEGIEFKKVTCPVCKNTFLFSDFKKVSGFGNDSTGAQSDDETPTDTSEFSLNFTLGELQIPELNTSFQLKPGKNIIGRKATVSSATIQIPCNTKRMSREHLVIEIKKDQNKGFVHYASLFKEKVNPTFIGTTRLEYGDCVVLQNGDIIDLPDLKVIFNIPDTEGTDYED